MVVTPLRKVLPSLSPTVKHPFTATSKRKNSPGISLSLRSRLLLLALLKLLCVLSLSPGLLPGKFHEQGDSDSLQLRLEASLCGFHSQLEHQHSSRAENPTMGFVP